MTLEIIYDRSNQTLRLIKTLRRPQNDAENLYNIMTSNCTNTFLEHVFQVTNQRADIRIVKKTKEIKVGEYTLQHITPAESRAILFELNFNTVYADGTILKEVKLHNFKMDSYGYRGDVIFECIQVEEIKINFTYSDALHELEDILETHRFVKETQKPFSYVNELVTTGGDNALFGLNLGWSYRPYQPYQLYQPQYPVQEIDQVQFQDHTNITYAQLRDEYGMGSVHIYLRQN